MEPYKRIFVVLALLISATGGSSAHAARMIFGGPTDNKKFGLGFALGSPTAITGKYFKDPVHAIDVGVGYWFGNYIEVYGDYLWHFPYAFARTQSPGPQFVPYIGLGGDIHIASSAPTQNDNNHPTVGFYARIPLGMEWMPQSAPLGVFLEIVPAIQVIPGIYGAFGAAIGARFYF